MCIRLPDLAAFKSPGRSDPNMAAWQRLLPRLIELMNLTKSSSVSSDTPESPFGFIIRASPRFKFGSSGSPTFLASTLPPTAQGDEGERTIARLRPVRDPGRR
jgi:hypothetical protein